MNQVTKGCQTRLMYIENKDGEIDGFQARVGWVTFSKSGLSIYYRDRHFCRLKGERFDANYFCKKTNDGFWISGIKKRGSNIHWSKTVSVHVDEDALNEYNKIKNI